MNQAFLDYYNLQPLWELIHSALCSVMPEGLAIFLECVVVGVIIMVLYAVLAIILIYMERKVCAAFQCRIGPNRVGGKGGFFYPDFLLPALAQRRGNPAHEHRYSFCVSCLFHWHFRYPACRME